MCEKATLHMDPAHLIFDVATCTSAYIDPLTDANIAEIQNYSLSAGIKRTIWVVNIFSFGIRPWCTIPASESALLKCYFHWHISKLSVAKVVPSLTYLNSEARPAAAAGLFI